MVLSNLLTTQALGPPHPSEVLQDTFPSRSQKEFSALGFEGRNCEACEIWLCWKMH